MAAKDQSRTGQEEPLINPRDIFFECPACNKSLVVDETAEGMMIECPKCHINVIVPPKAQSTLPPLPSGRAEPPARPAEATPAAEGDDLQQRLNSLASQMREQQTQWTEITNRIASRINDVNRELITLGRLEASHKHVLKEWNQLVAEIAAKSPPAPPR